MYHTHPHPPPGTAAYAVPPYQQAYASARPQAHPTASAQPGSYWVPPTAGYNPSPYQSPHHSPPAFQSHPVPPTGAYASIPKPSARTHRASFAFYTSAAAAAQPTWDGHQYTTTPPRQSHPHAHTMPSTAHAHSYAHPQPSHIPTAMPSAMPNTVPLNAEYQHAPPPKPRARRASYAYASDGTHRPARHSHSEPQPFPNPQVPPEPEKHVKATQEDLNRAKIPAGFATDNWNPSEEPIIVLGSVFDPYHLGKWIFDWCVYRFGARSRETELASRLWFSLISVSSNYKKAMRVKDCRIEVSEARTMGEFRDSANRLWARLKTLIKDCEKSMWNGNPGGAKAKSTQLAEDAGTHFVDTMFGEGNRRDMTVQLLQSMSLWEFRFHANCDDIIRASRKK